MGQYSWNCPSATEILVHIFTPAVGNFDCVGLIKFELIVASFFAMILVMNMPISYQSGSNLQRSIGGKCPAIPCSRAPLIQKKKWRKIDEKSGIRKGKI